MRRTFGLPMVIVVICATVLWSRSDAQSTLVIGYALDEGSGAIASDASGSNANGTLVDAPTWTSPGRFGGSLVLNGTSQYVSTDSPNLPTGDFTWALWVKRQSNDSFQTLMEAQGTTLAEFEWNLIGGALTVWSSGSERLVTTSVVPADTWTHVAVTREGDVLRAYIDGVADGQTGVDSRALDFAACPLLIGVDADGGCTEGLNGYLQAEIDEVQIHSRALTAAEIQQMMGAPLGESGPDTTAPVRSTSQPSITAPAGTTQLSIALTTNENATCRYELTPDVAFASMSGLFSSTGTTTHTHTVSGLSDGSTRTFHIKCQDTAANANTDDFLITVTVAPPGPPPPAAQATFYVAPGGDDQDPGTLEEPFQTIDRARQAVRGVNGSMSGDIQVVLRGGEYNLASTVTFGQLDSGTNGHDVIYEAYPGERPVLHGGQHVTGWTAAGGGIYKAQVGALRFRQLYVNGKRAVRARTPNTGAYNQVVYWDIANQRVQVGNGQVGTWQRQNQVEMIILGRGVNQSNLRIASISGAVVTPLEPERTRLFQQSYPPKDVGRPYYFENALEFLDTPGEWYLNTDTGEVHYMPRAGENLATADVVVPRLERLLAVSGTLAAPVRHLQFKNLTFAYTTWLRPDTEGFVGDQASVVFTQPLPADEISSYPGHRHPAAVHVEAADDIAFERNVFSHLGSSGLNLYESTHDNRVVGNVFTDISASGISVGLDLFGNPANPLQVSSGAVIQNNYLSETGVEFYQTVGIMVGYGDSVVIEHNELSKMPYSAISVGWGWANEDNAARNNLVRYNEIQDVLKTMSDGGGIYTLSLQPGTFISDNYVHDIVRTGVQGGFNISGIYLDEGSNYITVRDNVLRSTGDRGVFEHAVGPDNSYANNDGQSAVTMQNAGLEPAYEDIRPDSTPPEDPSVSTFIASPPTIGSGQSSTLTWTTTNATSVSIDQGIGSVATSGTLSVSPAATTTYTITATNGSASATATATVTVAPLPTITFSASPVTIAPGQSSTLTWSTSNATSVSIDQGIGSVATSGTLSVSPATTTTYTITATNGSASATATATVTVVPLPIITFSASPLTIAPGQLSTLTWSTTNATSVRINAGIGPVVTTGTRTVSPHVTTTFTMTATNAFGWTTATATVTVDEAPPPLCLAVGGDFDNDRRSDITVFRPGTGGWFNLHSNTGYATFSLTTWGMAGDIPVPGDYDCDGRLDLAVYRPSTSVWWVLKSSSNNTAFAMYQWGATGDVPVPGDYDGDGMSDLAVYRPSGGQWLVLKSSSNYQTGEMYNWGAAGTDVPVGGDYDGDGKLDLAVYRPSSGTWWILQSSTGFTTFLLRTWGLSSDSTVPGDYDGDGKTDPAVFRASTRTWYILKSSTNYTTYWIQAWGLSTDISVPADYDGDGRSDLAVYRPSTGEWFILRSTTNYTTFMMRRWGLSTDIPINKRP